MIWRAADGTFEWAHFIYCTYAKHINDFSLSPCWRVIVWSRTYELFRNDMSEMERNRRQSESDIFYLNFWPNQNQVKVSSAAIFRSILSLLGLLERMKVGLFHAIDCLWKHEEKSIKSSGHFAEMKVKSVCQMYGLWNVRLLLLIGTSFRFLSAVIFVSFIHKVWLYL